MMRITTAAQLGARTSNLKQLALLGIARDGLLADLEDAGKIRIMALTAKLHEQDLPSFAAQIRDALCDAISTYESAGARLTFQIHLLGFRVASEMNNERS